MRRREFITLVGGAAATWPLSGRAQQPGAVWRIGILINGSESDPAIAAFRQELKRLGWSERGNVAIDYRFSGDDPGRLPQLAKDLVAEKPDIILVNTTPGAQAVQRETRTIPVVFVSVSDPIGSGIVSSLARPGSNFTGLLLYEEGITGKWLGMLKEIAPRLLRVALLANPKATPYDYFLRSARAGAPLLGIEIVPAPIDGVADIEPTIESFARKTDGGLLVPSDSTTLSNRDLVVAVAARHNLPAVYPFRAFVDAGGLMSYESIGTMSFYWRLHMSTASCAARSPPTCRYRRRPSTKPWSISRPPRLSALTCRRPCWSAPTR